VGQILYSGLISTCELNIIVREVWKGATSRFSHEGTKKDMVQSNSLVCKSRMIELKKQSKGMMIGMYISVVLFGSVQR
jgi:hypothetical protein